MGFNVYKLVERTAEMKLVELKWVMTIKKKADGEIEI
jgi:hypothetical protein